MQNRIAEKSKMNLTKNTKYACRGGWPRCMALTKDVIQKYNQKALASEKHPRDVYREPSALIVICANANMAYTTDSGVTCWLFKRLKNSRFDFKQGDCFFTW